MPFLLSRDLLGHESASVHDLGWAGTKNGALLTRAEANGFDVLVTLDDDIEGEQNMRDRRIAILVIKPRKQGKQAVREMAALALDALTNLRPGEIRVVRPNP
jgi:hypothetical protein